VWARFSAPVQTGPGAHPACYKMGTGAFPGVKRPARGADHPLPSSAEVEERVRVIHLLFLRAFVAYSTVNFTFTFDVPVFNVMFTIYESVIFPAVYLGFKNDFSTYVTSTLSC